MTYWIIVFSGTSLKPLQWKALIHRLLLVHFLIQNHRQALTLALSLRHYLHQRLGYGGQPLSETSETSGPNWVLKGNNGLLLLLVESLTPTLLSTPISLRGTPKNFFFCGFCFRIFIGYSIMLFCGSVVLYIYIKVVLEFRGYSSVQGSEKKLEILIFHMYFGVLAW